MLADRERARSDRGTEDADRAARRVFFRGRAAFRLPWSGYGPK